MIPEKYRNLSGATIRGWFWQEAVRLDAMTDLATQVDMFIKDMPGKIGVRPSLDSSLQKCVEAGKRLPALDGSIRGVIELGYSKIAPIKPLLIKLIYEVERRFPVPLPPIAEGVLERLPASQPTVEMLHSMVRFGALNVTYFAETPPPLRLTAIKNLAWAILGDPERSDSVAKASAPVQFKCGAVQMKEMSSGVMAAQGGVCTTFAATAAHLLLTDAALSSSNPRIEFVSGPKHCLCLVNRKTHADDKIGARSDPIVSYPNWNDEVVIIDPWAGAMGFHVLSTIQSYPAKLKSMIGLKVDRYFDSHAV